MNIIKIVWMCAQPGTIKSGLYQKPTVLRDQISLVLLTTR